MHLNNQSLLPLTKSQTSLWLVDKLNPNTPINNVPYAFNIKGNVDHDVFKLAFDRLIESTDILRTVIEEENNQPKQRTTPYVKSIELIDFSRQSSAELSVWLKQKSSQPFNLSQQLFYSALLKTSDENYIWYLNIHHIITDASSSVILFNALASIYNILLQNKGAPMVPMPAYSEFVKYEQEERIKNVEITTQWEEKIASFNETPALYGKKRLQGLSTTSNRVEFEVGNDELDAIRQKLKDQNISFWNNDVANFMIFGTLLFAYMFRISGQKKLVVGAPIHNRIKQSFIKTAGLFIEMLPLAVEVDDEDTFLSLFKKVKIETNNYLKNGLTGTSSAKLSRSFITIFNYINSSFGDFAGLETEVNWMHPEHADPGHKMRFHVCNFNQKGSSKVIIDYNNDIADAQKASSSINHVEKLFDNFVRDINKPIQGASISTDEEQNFFLSPPISGNALNNVLDVFQRLAKEYPNAIAVQSKNETLTFNGLNKKANQLAHYLFERGVRANDKVVLLNYRNTNYILGVLAIMKLGGTFIPIASDQPKERVAFIISNSEASLILTEGTLQKHLEGIDVANIDLEEIKETLKIQSEENLRAVLTSASLAYVLYTSGSTGNPKGVLISHEALSNYIFWAKDYYGITNKTVLPLFTSIGFDLTITSTLLPFVSGGRLMLYTENIFGPDMSLIQVLADNLVNTIKLTPSHLSFLKDRDLSSSIIHTMIVGGEDFKVNLASTISKKYDNKIAIYNEYGPTEATVGCIVSKFDITRHEDEVSVPIGYPISNMHAYILDDCHNLVPHGVMGKLYLSGRSLANGYLKLEDLSNSKFIDNPFVAGEKMYHTGDVARINKNGEYEYLGRFDEQIKLRGYRIELTDIEANLANYEGIDDCAVVLVDNKKDHIPEAQVVNCTECGLPSNYPQTDFDEHGVCNLCNTFKGYKEKAQRYFKTEEELKEILLATKGTNPKYDCLSLLSGGKDSTYILAQLVNMGMKVLAFTLDNGYISDQAKANIDRIVDRLGVDHIYGETEYMNAIFVDSLKRHKNVCNGCFKTIYTLSTKIALEHKIPFIVTGLSRGQFFETRLTEELFWDEDLDVTKIDDTILEVRKLYHQEEDAVKKLLDVSMFETDEVFDKVQFIDFYRYSDVSLEDMLKFLNEKVGWVRPTDTGRSTNCLINQVGIYVHKKELGYSNYSFPYSWDVRLGHKTRDESLEEINEYIHEPEVKRIMKEIGYEDSDDFTEDEKLVAYYTGNISITQKELKQYLASKIPSYMVPSVFKNIDQMPLTKNGKTDKKSLRSLTVEQLEMEVSYVAPRNEIEDMVEGVWKEVLRLEKIGVYDNFIALGGHSLAAIRVTSRINEELELELPLNKVFNLPTIDAYSKYIESTLTELLNED
ncbi:non-ribosomal peptide synthetase [Hyunsoonleella ulvae]|uniref:non-ribosomal peptide synthetase n=1 Tax=Hyunsoonleella ulvae TaxID=2799948 RepID=UPI001939B101|nr:non-ribosomal peptide synthetase [Hyunsoonleella ulvae]